MTALVQALRSGTWLSKKRLRRYPLVFLLAYGIVGVPYLVRSEGYRDPWGRPVGTDFVKDYAASKLTLAGHPQLVYDTQRHAQTEHEVIGTEGSDYYAWLYPPMALFVILPFALVSYGSALVLWITTTLAAWLAVMRRIVCVPGVIVAALAFPAVLVNIGHGHNGFLTAALFGAALLMIRADKPWLAGLLFGLMTYKPQFGLLIPFALLAGGHWRVFVAAAMASLLLAGASLIAFGSETWQAYFSLAELTRTEMLEQGATGWHKIQSVFSLVRGLGGNIPFAYATQGMWTLLFLAGVVLLWRGSCAPELKAAGLVVASLAATPYVIDYDLIVLGIAIAFQVAHGLRAGFMPWEKSMLALAWCWPLFCRPLAQVTSVQLTPLLLGALFVLILRKGLQESGTGSCAGSADGAA